MTTAKLEAIREEHARLYADDSCSSCTRCYLRNNIWTYDEDCAECLGTGCTQDHVHEIAETICAHGNLDECLECASERGEDDAELIAKEIGRC